MNLARSEDPASFLPPNADPTVLAGYVAQRNILAQKYGSFGAPVGSMSWNTGPDTTIYMVKPFSRGSITLNVFNCASVVRLAPELSSVGPRACIGGVAISSLFLRNRVRTISRSTGSVSEPKSISGFASGSFAALRGLMAV